MNVRSRRAGFTLAEVVVASSIGFFVLLSVTSIMVSTGGSWLRGENQMDGESDARYGVRLISQQLQEATYATVAADGMSVQYELPEKLADGSLRMPLRGDGVTRRLFLDEGNLMLQAGTAPPRLLVRGVMITDPFRTASANWQLGWEGNAANPATRTGPPYQLFVPETPNMTRVVTVTLVVSGRGGGAGEAVRTRKREAVTLRNFLEVIR